MGTFVYAMRDQDSRGLFPIPSAKADEYNRRGFGIFFNPQSLPTPKRGLANIDFIRCIAVDLDKDEEKGILKEDMPGKIAQCDLMPTLINETKNGYHLFWLFKPEDWIPLSDSNRREVNNSYKLFIEERLSPLLDCDKRAIDAARMLRMPGFYHMKSPDDPFLVTIVHRSSTYYTIDQMKESFPVLEKKEVEREVAAKKKKINLNFKDDVDYCKRGIDILDLAEYHGIKPKMIGGRIKASCKDPSHRNGDRNPSMALYPDTNSYYCYGCANGGDVIDFHMQFSSKTFAESVTDLTKIFRRKK